MPELSDLEVYFQGIEDEALCAWLSAALGDTLAPKPRGAGGSAQQGGLTLRLTPRALGGWHALGLEPPSLTPWRTDQALGEALALAFPAAKLRYAAAPWAEGDALEADRFLEWQGQAWREIPWKG